MQAPTPTRPNGDTTAAGDAAPGADDARKSEGGEWSSVRVERGTSRGSPFPPSPRDTEPVMASSVLGAAVLGAAAVLDGVAADSPAEAFPAPPHVSASGRPIRKNRGMKRHSIVDSPPPSPVRKRKKTVKKALPPPKKRAPAKKKPTQRKRSAPASRGASRGRAPGRSRARVASGPASVCEHDGCSVIPCFGLCHDKIKRWCVDHHPAQAISLRTKVRLCSFLFHLQSSFHTSPVFVFSLSLYLLE